MNLSQCVYDKLTTAESGFWSRRRGRRILESTRKRLVRKLGDPPVQFSFDEVRIDLPLSHNIGVYWRQFPHYGRNLGRLGAAIQKKYPNLTAVDIGANVGDSLAVLRTCARFPILAVEGNRKYLPLLESNSGRLGDIEICRTFLDSRSGQRQVQVFDDAGTSHVVAGGPEAETMAFRTLESVLAEHPRFVQAKLVKVDTDGYDGLILCGAARWIALAQPVVFMEYDPHSWDRQGDDGTEVFAMFRSAGYESLLVYDNFGELLYGARLDNQDLLDDMRRHFSGHSSLRLADLAVFSKQDSDLYQRFRQSEWNYFLEARKTALKPE